MWTSLSSKFSEKKLLPMNRKGKACTDTNKNHRG